MGEELVPEPREQETVALVRQLVEEGLNTRQIAAQLEELRLGPKVGEHWSSVQVLRPRPRRWCNGCHRVIRCEPYATTVAGSITSSLFVSLGMPTTSVLARSSSPM